MTPAAHDITIYQGATLRMPLRWLSGPAGAVVPVDLTGYTVRAQLRRRASSPEILATFTCVITDAADGRFELSLSAVTTAAIAARAGVYDVELVSPGGDVYRFLEGAVSISHEVTR